jgi:ketol-acid reductoisomerase
VEPSYASKLLQHGWETVSEALKQGGITNMMDRLSNPAKIKAFELSEELKTIMKPLYQKHQDDIISGEFSSNMMKDWANGDKKLLAWREATGKTPFEKTAPTEASISEQEYFDKGLLIVAMVKAGVELAFETMVSAGMKPASAYYESLHETPLIANLISRKKLYEMNRVISDTAEYGCYLFANSCVPLLENFMQAQGKDVIGTVFNEGKSNRVDNRRLIEVNAAIRQHPVEEIGAWLRSKMRGMKQL